MNDACLTCNSKEIKSFICKEDIPSKREVLRCRACGLVFFKNDEKDSDDAYWNEDKQKGMYEEIKVRSGFIKEFKDKLKIINGYVKKGKLLDVGCGTGEFLDIARSLGWQPYGIDISKRAADFVKQKYDIDISCGPVENSRFQAGYFDAITLWDVIEHIPYPKRTMTAINKRLKKGGLLAIKTPDDNGLFKRIASFLYSISHKRLKFLLKYVYYIPHYYSYNYNTLKRLLENHGFTIEALKKERTNIDFARTKIKYHYAKYRSKAFVLLILPMVYFLMNVFGLHNKMVIYARKR